GFHQGIRLVDHAVATDQIILRSDDLLWSSTVVTHNTAQTLHLTIIGLHKSSMDKLHVQRVHKGWLAAPVRHRTQLLRYIHCGTMYIYCRRVTCPPRNHQVKLSQLLTLVSVFNQITSTIEMINNVEKRFIPLRLRQATHQQASDLQMKGLRLATWYAFIGRLLNAIMQELIRVAHQGRCRHFAFRRLQQTRINRILQLQLYIPLILLTDNAQCVQIKPVTYTCGNGQQSLGSKRQPRQLLHQQINNVVCHACSIYTT